MAGGLLPISAGLPADLRAEIEDAQDTLAATKAGSTRKAYASDWELRQARDRAILAIDMAGAFRRSELATMQLRALRVETAGLRITIPRSKRDQEGLGQKVAIPDGRVSRPVTLLKLWIEAAGLDGSDLKPAITRRSRSFAG
jgi:hypothetical protein